MKHLILILVVAFIYTFGSSGCVNNSEEDLYGLECDTLNMTYSKIKYIFEDNCYTCHTESYYNHDIKTDSYTNLKAAVNTGKLLPAINWTGTYQMPKGQEKLDACQIAKIQAWVNAGMPE